MRSVTGIELAPDRCLMVRVRGSRGRAYVSAVYGLGPADVQPGDPDFATRLDAVRRQGSFPRRARVVAWGTGAQGAPSNPVAHPALEPLRRAGFRIEAMCSPADALVALARDRTRAGDSAEVWLAVNEDRGALAVVLDGSLLFSRTLEWNRQPPAVTPREELLHRYLLVSRLAPEIRHAAGSAGVRVERVVTCGTLPDLRSLTMPLMEELGAEVATLDSLDGIVLAPAAAPAGERTAALRLACAATEAAVSPGRIRLVSAAAVFLAAGATAVFVGWGGDRRGAEPAGDQFRTAAPRATVAPPAPAAAVGGPGGEGVPDISPPPAGPGPAGSAAGARGAGTRPPQDGGMPLSLMWERPAGRAAIPATEGTTGAVRTGPARGQDREDEPPLTVNSILVSPGRTAAVVDGQVVREGDRIGDRIVVRIERRGVTLREPSGREVLLTIRRDPRHQGEPDSLP